MLPQPSQSLVIPELQLSEVLDGANHLRGVGVFVCTDFPKFEKLLFPTDLPHFCCLWTELRDKKINRARNTSNLAQLSKQNHVKSAFPIQSVGYADYMESLSRHNSKIKQTANYVSERVIYLYRIHSWRMQSDEVRNRSI